MSSSAVVDQATRQADEDRPAVIDLSIVMSDQIGWFPVDSARRAAIVERSVDLTAILDLAPPYPQVPMLSVQRCPLTRVLAQRACVATT
jgi:hypothetical protein